MTQFKHGDIVKIISDCSNVCAGDICTIVDKRGYLYAYNENENVCSCEYNWILIEKAPQSIEIKFRKVGSKQIIMK